jgi:hypothetical protein
MNDQKKAVGKGLEMQSFAQVKMQTELREMGRNTFNAFHFKFGGKTLQMLDSMLKRFERGTHQTSATLPLFPRTKTTNSR